MRGQVKVPGYVNEYGEIKLPNNKWKYLGLQFCNMLFELPEGLFDPVKIVELIKGGKLKPSIKEGEVHNVAIEEGRRMVREKGHLIGIIEERREKKAMFENNFAKWKELGRQLQYCNHMLESFLEGYENSKDNPLSSSGKYYITNYNRHLKQSHEIDEKRAELEWGNNQVIKILSEILNGYDIKSVAYGVVGFGNISEKRQWTILEKMEKYGVQVEYVDREGRVKFKKMFDFVNYKEPGITFMDEQLMGKPGWEYE